MARILALDYGEKRTGIAVTDDFQIIASGLTTVQTDTLLPFLKAYAQKEVIALIVVGAPKRYNGIPSDIEVSIKKFLQKLSIEIPNIPVRRVDERFTSKLASRAMIDGGLKKKQRRNKALIDEISATIILQSYLAMNSNSQKI